MRQKLEGKPTRGSAPIEEAFPVLDSKTRNRIRAKVEACECGGGVVQPGVESEEEPKIPPPPAAESNDDTLTKAQIQKMLDQMATLMSKLRDHNQRQELMKGIRELSMQLKDAPESTQVPKTESVDDASKALVGIRGALMKTHSAFVSNVSQPYDAFMKAWGKVGAKQGGGVKAEIDKLAKAISEIQLQTANASKAIDTVLKHAWMDEALGDNLSAKVGDPPRSGRRAPSTSSTRAK
jgi:hypothetical protein